jgi:hypothetical protein
MENRLYRREKGGDENVSLFETSALACLYITWVDGEEAHGTRALNIKQRFAPDLYLFSVHSSYPSDRKK